MSKPVSLDYIRINIINNIKYYYNNNFPLNGTGKYKVINQYHDSSSVVFSIIINRKLFGICYDKIYNNERSNWKENICKNKR